MKKRLIIFFLIGILVGILLEILLYLITDNNNGFSIGGPPLTPKQFGQQYPGTTFNGGDSVNFVKADSDAGVKLLGSIGDANGKIVTMKSYYHEYTGTIKNYKPHGKGGVMTTTMQHKKVINSGEFEDGSLINGTTTVIPGDGQGGYNNDGVITFTRVKGKIVKSIKANGDKYVGEFIEDGHSVLENGSGTLTYKDGTIHKGTFKNGKLIKGSITRPNGDIATGDVVNGIIYNGSGTLTYKDGAKFKGTWKGGMPEKGKLTLKDGTISEGIFKDGWLIKGKITTKNGTVTNGTFKDGILIKGTIVHTNGDHANIENGMMTGSGRITTKDGQIEVGTFKDGKLINGTMTRPNGIIDRGDFVDGELTHGTRRIPAYGDQPAYTIRVNRRSRTVCGVPVLSPPQPRPDDPDEGTELGQLEFPLRGVSADDWHGGARGRRPPRGPDPGGG